LEHRARQEPLRPRPFRIERARAAQVLRAARVVDQRALDLAAQEEPPRPIRLQCQSRVGVRERLTERGVPLPHAQKIEGESDVRPELALRRPGVESAKGRMRARQLPRRHGQSRVERRGERGRRGAARGRNPVARRDEAAAQPAQDRLAARVSEVVDQVGLHGAAS
jgi:hypothetical protein